VSETRPATPAVENAAPDRGQDWPFWLLMVGILVLLMGMPLPITDGDPAYYAVVARDLLASGDWLAFHADKPPLTTWLINLSFAVFGKSDWALRAWHLALALGTVAVTYALARLALPRRQSALAALILLTAVQFFYQSLTPEQDIPLTLFVALAVYGHLRWEREGRAGMCILSWSSMALAMLSKGLIGIALPVMVVGAHLLIDRPALPKGALRASALGALCFLVLAAPWFVLGALHLGRGFLDTFFLGGTLGVGRFFHQMLFSPTTVSPWLGLGAYVIFLPLGVLPWTGWLWPALREGWDARRARGSALWVCMLWVIVIFVFQSLAPGDKTIRYILPLFPPLAVLLGRAVAAPRWARQAAWVSLVVALPWVAIIVVVLRGSVPGDLGKYAPLLLPFLAAFALALAGYSLATFADGTRWGVAVLVLVTLLAYVLLMSSIGRNWDQISPWRPAARIIGELRAPKAPVLIAGPYSEFADYYIWRKPEFVGGDDLVHRWQEGSAIAVVPVSDLPRLTSPRPAIAVRIPTGLAVVANFPPSP